MVQDASITIVFIESVRGRLLANFSTKISGIAETQDLTNRSGGYSRGQRSSSSI